MTAGPFALEDARRREIWETLTSLAAYGALASRGEPISEGALAAEVERVRKMAKKLRPASRVEALADAERIIDEALAATVGAPNRGMFGA